MWSWAAKKEQLSVNRCWSRGCRSRGSWSARSTSVVTSESRQVASVHEQRFGSRAWATTFLLHWLHSHQSFPHLFLCSIHVLIIFPSSSSFLPHLITVTASVPFSSSFSLLLLLTLHSHSVTTLVPSPMQGANPWMSQGITSLFEHCIRHTKCFLRFITTIQEKTHMEL